MRPTRMCLECRGAGEQKRHRTGRSAVPAIAADEDRVAEGFLAWLERQKPLLESVLLFAPQSGKPVVIVVEAES